MDDVEPEPEPEPGSYPGDMELDALFRSMRYGPASVPAKQIAGWIMEQGGIKRTGAYRLDDVPPWLYRSEGRAIDELADLYSSEFGVSPREAERLILHALQTLPYPESRREWRLPSRSARGLGKRRRRR